MSALNLNALGFKGVIEKLSNSKDFDISPVIGTTQGFYESFEYGPGEYSSTIMKGPVIEKGRMISLQSIAIYDQFNTLHNPCYTCGLPYSSPDIQANTSQIPNLKHAFSLCFFCIYHYIGFRDSYGNDYKPVGEYGAEYNFYFDKEFFITKYASDEQIIRESDDEELILGLVTSASEDPNYIQNAVKEIMEKRERQPTHQYGLGTTEATEDIKSIQNERKETVQPTKVENLPPFLRQTERPSFSNPFMFADEDYIDYYDNERKQDIIIYKSAFRFLKSNQLSNEQVEWLILNHYCSGVVLLALLLSENPIIFDKVDPEKIADFEHYFKIEPYHITEFPAFRKFRNAYLFYKIISNVPRSLAYYEDIEHFLRRIHSLPPSSERTEMNLWAFRWHHDTESLVLLPAETLHEIIPEVAKYLEHDQYIWDGFIDLLNRIVNEDINNFEIAIESILNLAKSYKGERWRFGDVDNDGYEDKGLTKLLQQIEQTPNPVEFLYSMAIKVDNKVSSLLKTIFKSINIATHYKYIDSLRDLTQKTGFRFKEIRILNLPFYTEEELKTENISSLTDTEDLGWEFNEYGWFTKELDNFDPTFHTVENFWDYVIHSSPELDRDFQAFWGYKIHKFLVNSYYGNIHFSSLPSSIVDHAELLTLNFGNCVFDEVPNIIKNSKHLVSLSFHDCSFDEINYEFFRFPNLRFLAFTDCSGIELDQLKSLNLKVEIETKGTKSNISKLLSKNKIHKDIQNLDISYRDLDHFLSIDYSKLPNLRALTLTAPNNYDKKLMLPNYNLIELNLIGFEDYGINELVSIENLSITGPQFVIPGTPPIILDFSKLMNLSEIRLSSINNLEELMLNDKAPITKIEFYTPIKNLDLSEFHSFTSFDVSFSGRDKDGVVKLGNYQDLISFKLNWYSIDEIIFEAHQNLKEIKLHRIKSDIIKIVDCNQLEKLELVSPSSEIIHISDLEKINSLKIRGIQASKILIRNCPNLEYLVLDSVYVNEIHISSLPKLIDVRQGLRSTKISLPKSGNCEIDKEIRNLKNFKIIYLDQYSSVYPRYTKIK